MSRLAKHALILSIGIVGSTCSAIADNGFGKIEGYVSLSPIEPMCREDRPCSGPYEHAEVSAQRGDDSVARTTADQRGHFSLRVRAGKYLVWVATTGKLPRCAKLHLLVLAGKTVEANIACDSGMR